MSWYYKSLHCSEALILSCVQKLTPHISVLCSCASVCSMCIKQLLIIYSLLVHTRSYLFYPRSSGPQSGTGIFAMFCTDLATVQHCQATQFPLSIIKPIICSQLSSIGSLSEQVSWVSVQDATHFKPPSPGNKIKCM